MAEDTTGLVPVALSTFYVRRTQPRDEPMLWCWWLKRLIVVDTKRQVLLAQEACSSGPYKGSAMLRPLTEAAREVAPLGAVPADAIFRQRTENHR